jgi:aminoglycoside phosphotransferase (APT) family kinase protein
VVHLDTRGAVDLLSLIEALRTAGIEAAFPETDLGGLAVVDRGFGSIVLGVPEQVLVRVPRTEIVATAHRRERRLVPRIARHVGVAIPNAVWVVAPTTELPWGASAYRWIDGSQPVVPISGTAALVGDLADFLAALHRTPMSLVSDIGLPGPLELARTRAEDFVVTAPVLHARLSPREYSKLQSRVGDILSDPILDDFVPVLRHGDLWFGNLLIDEHSTCLEAVLDWEHAAIGDPAEDLATQRYLGSDGVAALVDRYSQLVGGLDARALQRADHHFALREINGIRRCIEMSDEDELDEELRNLRSGPLLA